MTDHIQAVGDAADSSDMRALQLRARALALLQEARELDGLRPFAVTHRHEFGSSTYLLWAARTPQEHEAEAALDADYEPDREELAIEEDLTLEQLAGVAPEARLPNILESLQASVQMRDKGG